MSILDFFRGPSLTEKQQDLQKRINSLYTKLEELRKEDNTGQIRGLIRLEEQYTILNALIQRNLEEYRGLPGPLKGKFNRIKEAMELARKEAIKLVRTN